MFLSVTGEMGGAERALLDMLTSLRACHSDWPIALVLGGPGPLADAAAAAGATVTVLPIPASLLRTGESGASQSWMRMLGMSAGLFSAARGIRRYVTSLRRVVVTFAPDVLHTNSLKMHILGAWAHPASMALVWHLHDYIGCRPITARLLRWNRGACSEVVANSASVAADAQRTLGQDVRVSTVLNAVDLNRFSPSGSQADLDALAGLPSATPGTVRIGLISTFARWKGHLTLLEAVARLSPDLPVRVYVIGGPLYRTGNSQFTLDELKQRAESLALTGRVGFTGFIADIDRAIRALDIVVHASTQPEPFGLAIAEAMACGRAVIASDAGGAREIFTDGVDAVAHVPGDAAQLAQALEQLVRDAGARVRLGDAARATVERRFDRRRLAGELETVYRRVLRAA